METNTPSVNVTFRTEEMLDNCGSIVITKENLGIKLLQYQWRIQGRALGGPPPLPAYY